MNQARRIACFRPNDSKAAISHLLATRLNSSSKARKTKAKIRKNSYYIFIKKWHTKYECTQKTNVMKSTITKEGIKGTQLL